MKIKGQIKMAFPALVLSVIAVMMSFQFSNGYNSGSPLSTCVDMLPGTQPGTTAGNEGHAAPSQNDVPLYGNSRIAPYYIQVHGAESAPPSDSNGMDWLVYIPGHSYQVSIIANQTIGSNIFKGVLLMAREVTCATNTTIQVGEIPVGKFSVESNDLLRTISCNDQEDSAVTHNSPQYKINTTITWIAPTNQKVNVVFRATMVQSLTTYWVGVYSKVLRDGSVPAPAKCTASERLGMKTSWMIGTILIALVIRLVHI